MRLPFIVVLAACLSSSVCPALAQSDPQQMLNGYVSAITSATEFDLTGEHVVCDGKTQFFSPLGTGPAAAPCAGHTYMGEPLAIVEYSRRHAVLHAKILNVNNMPPNTSVSGYGILDLPIAAETTPTQGFLYADGRRLRLTKRTQLQFRAPLTALQDVHPGTWVAYEAHPEPDGSLTAFSLTFVPNTVSERETKLLKHITAHVVPPDYSAKKPGEVRFGDSKHVWTHIVADQSMQERVQTVGTRLIPAWQKLLPDSDPLRLHFQFFVVTHKSMHNDAFSFPDGTILIPEKIARKITDDQQLAVIIASNMAEILEKQGMRYLTADKTVGATGFIALGADFAPVPGLGPGLALGSVIAAREMLRRQNQQADRVSLQLLHQAGYDINQSFLARNAIDHKGNALATPYSTRAQSLLIDVGNWNAATLVHID